MVNPNGTTPTSTRPTTPNAMPTPASPTTASVAPARRLRSIVLSMSSTLRSRALRVNRSGEPPGAPLRVVPQCGLENLRRPGEGRERFAGPLDGQRAPRQLAELDAPRESQIDDPLP